MSVLKDPRKYLRIGINTDITSLKEEVFHGNVMFLDFNEELLYETVYKKINDYLSLVDKLNSLIKSVHEISEYKLDPFSEDEPKLPFQTNI